MKEFYTEKKVDGEEKNWIFSCMHKKNLLDMLCATMLAFDVHVTETTSDENFDV